MVITGKKNIRKIKIEDIKSFPVCNYYKIIIKIIKL
jgi:hypothetical protein